MENNNQDECLIYTGSSRHHIVPYSDLRDFFNGALRSNDINIRMRFKDFLRKMLDHALLSNHITDEDISVLLEQGTRTDMPIMRIPVLNLIITLYTENRINRIRDRIHALYTWMPFIWFYGYDPRNRADDPSGDFEATAARITSPKRPLEELRVLHRSIKLFVNYGTIRSFEYAMDLMEKMLDESSREDTDYGPFNPMDWTQVQPLGELCQFRIRQSRLGKRETGSFFNDANDPFCERTNATITRNLENKSFYFDAEKNTLWNVKAFITLFS